MRKRNRYRHPALAGCLAAVLFLLLLFHIAEAKGQEDPIRIGCSFSADGGNITFHVLYENLQILEEAAQVEFYRGPQEDMGNTTEAQVYYVESLIEEGVDGILLYPGSDQVLPAICRMCEEAEVYWGIFFWSILDEDVRKLCEASEYYIGNTYENEEESAYNLTRKAAQKGYRKLALISGATWNTTCEAREKGIKRAVDETEEMEILTEVREMQSQEDAEENVKSLLAAYPEMDCIYLVGSTVSGVQGKICSVLEQERGDRPVGFVTIDFSDHLTEDFESGVLTAAYGLPQLSLDPYYMAVKMVNTLKGYPLEEHYTSHYVNGVLLESAEQAREMADIIENPDLLYFSKEFVEQNLFKWNNPALDGEEFQRIINENERLENSITKPASP